MYRVTSLTLAACAFFALAFGSATVAGQEKKTPPDPLSEAVLGKSVGEWIQILRTHKDIKYRRVALIALEGSNTAGKSGLPALLACIEKDTEPQVRQEAVMLLGRLGPETNGAIKSLIGALQNDKEDRVREAAASSIANNKFLKQAEDYMPVLVAGLKDKHAGTRVAVAGILRDMGKNAQPAFAGLFDSLKDADEHLLVRGAALHVLSRFAKDDPKTVPLLVDLLKNSKTPPALREAAAEALGRADTEATDVITLLAETLSDKKQSIELRKASAVALGKLGLKARAAWPTVKKHVTEVAEDSNIRNHLIRLTGALAPINAEAVLALASVAKMDSSTENRIAAIQELGELDALPKEVRDILQMIATADARAAIREAAEKALKK